MRFIGLTGGVGAGKTMVLREIERLFPARVLIADEIAHDLMEPGTACHDALREAFHGRDVWREDGGFDRAKLAGLIFSEEAERARLDAIVHPAVREYVCAEAERARLAGDCDYLVLEAALLIEEHYDEVCDELWYVYAPPEIRRRRLMDARGYSAEKVSRIFAAQLPDEIYRRHCRVVIDNSRDARNVADQLERLIGRA